MRFIAALTFAVLVAAPAYADLNVTVSEGTNMAAAVSPDGKQLVLDLQGTLWVLPAAGGAAKAITEPLMDARQPAWAPDNKTIAFQAFGDGGWHLWSVRADGTGLTQLTKGLADEREPQYAPDGKSLLFSSDRNGNYDVFVMPATGGEARAVVTSPGNDFAPAWSPDGKNITFISDRDKAAGVYTLNLEGKTEKLLVKLDGAGGMGGPSYSAPSWQPGGSAIVFVAQHRDHSTLRSVDVMTGAVSDLSAPEEDVFPFRATWAGASAKSMIYTADAGVKRREGDSAAVKVPFTAVFDLTRPAYTRKQRDFTDAASKPVQGIRAPKVSPDGKQIVFSALGDLWVEDIDERTLSKGLPKARRFTNDVALDADASWSPDGTQMAFISDRTGKPQIWLRDLNTNKDRQLTTVEEDVAAPVWSPDSKRIAFFKVVNLNGLGSGTLNVVEVFTGDVKQAHPAIWAPSAVSWSPDGKTLVMNALSPSSSRFREGLTKFLLISLTGAADRYVSPVPDRSMAMRGVNGPIWSPDGTQMAYVHDGVLWTVPVVSSGDKVGDMAGAPRALTTELAEAPSWTGDSKALVYLATDKLKRITLDGKVTDVHPALTWKRDIPRGRTVVWAGRLWDGVAKTYRDNVDVVVDGNVITAIEPHQDRSSDKRALVINASHNTVIPGLIESHTHMAAPFGSRFGRLWLSYGVTSVREPGTDPYDALERRESWASGKRPGPREFYTGGLTDGARVFYGMANSVTTPAHLELEMERAKRLDYDLIKTYVRMPDHFQKTIVAKAHAIGIPVSSHELYPAVGYGVDAVEHLRGTSRRGYSPKQSETGFSYGDVVDLLSKSGMTITPTMGLQSGFTLTALRDPSILSNPQYVALYRESERNALAASTERSRANIATMEHTVAAMQKAVRDIVAQGGHVTAGTDSPFVPYGLSFLAELKLYEAGGLTPFQVLQSATSWPAQALGVDKQLGTLEPGKLADLVVLDGDPLAHIGDLANVKGVVADGHYYLIDELLRRLGTAL